MKSVKDKVLDDMWIQSKSDVHDGTHWRNRNRVYEAVRFPVQVKVWFDVRNIINETFHEISEG